MTLYANIIALVVTFLHLLLNGAPLLSTGLHLVGVGIEVSKLSQASQAQSQRYVDSGTKSFDSKAMTLLSGVFVALMLIQAGYSAISSEQGVEIGASFLLSTAVDVISIYGIALMIPQMYINYKLQSTAHMPFWTLFFRFMTSIFDDYSLLQGYPVLPSVNRLAGFRDEVVFVVYIYQLMMYPNHR